MKEGSSDTLVSWTCSNHIITETQFPFDGSNINCDVDPKETGIAVKDLTKCDSENFYKCGADASNPAQPQVGTNDGSCELNDCVFYTDHLCHTKDTNYIVLGKDT